MSLIQNGSPAIIVHPSGIIDPSDDGHCHLVALLKDYYEEKLTSIVKGGYDFVDVWDVVEASWKPSKKARLEIAVSCSAITIPSAKY